MVQSSNLNSYIGDCPVDDMNLLASVEHSSEICKGQNSSKPDATFSVANSYVLELQIHELEQCRFSRTSSSQDKEPSRAS